MSVRAGERVLLVDTDSRTIWSIGRFLVQAGCRVVTCSESKEAMVLLNHQAFALLVVGIREAPPWGLDLLQWVALHRPQLPTIALVTQKTSSLEKICRENGVETLCSRAAGESQWKALFLARGSPAKEERVGLLTTAFQEGEADLFQERVQRRSPLLVEEERGLLPGEEERSPLAAKERRRVLLEGDQEREAEGHLSDSPWGEGSGLLATLREAERSAEGGEVLVREGRRVARFYFVAHRLSWLEWPSVSSMEEIVLHLGVEGWELEEAVADGERSGGHWLDKISEWGLVGQRCLRAYLGFWIAWGLRQSLAWSAPRHLFIPQPHQKVCSLTYPLEELLALARDLDEEQDIPWGENKKTPDKEELVSLVERILPNCGA